MKERNRAISNETDRQTDRQTYKETYKRSEREKETKRKERENTKGKEWVLEKQRRKDPHLC
jgi:hypothetical protein